VDGELEAVFVFWPRFTSLFYSRLAILGTQHGPINAEFCIRLRDSGPLSV